MVFYPFIHQQDAAGIVTCGNKGRLYQIKGNGMVRDVFDQPKLEQLVGSMGVGHGMYLFDRVPPHFSVLNYFGPGWLTIWFPDGVPKS